MQTASRAMACGAARSALACGSALLALAAFELGYRVHTHRAVFGLDDWRAGRIEFRIYGDRGGFDPMLGWAPRGGYESDDYNTIEAGIRRNFRETAIRAGGVLAVGDIFTDGGMEVTDGETWPAHLERMLGIPVLNAGVAGYAPDQIVLRAEQLLAAAQPKTLVVGLLDDGITRAGMSSFGTAKPYFTLEGGQLVFHPPDRTVLYQENLYGWRAKVRDLMGRSAVLDVVLSRLSPQYWHGRAGKQIFHTVDNDPASVTCALLRRLKTRTDAAGVRMVLLMQYARETIAEKTEPGTDAKKVIQCAASLAIAVVDQFAALRALAAADPDRVGGLYLQDDGGKDEDGKDGDGNDDDGGNDRPAHMSSAGNRHTAELLARALK